MTERASVAVVDDEPRMVEIVCMVLKRAGYQAVGFDSPHNVLKEIGEARFDLLLTDLRMPEMDGVTLLKEVRKVAPELPVVLFTAHATIRTAIEAMREGAFDYVQKPFDNDELRNTVARALEHAALKRDNRYLRAAAHDSEAASEVIAESASMRRVMEMVRRVAPSMSTVLVTGPSGTGKEVVARAVHYFSNRADGPFVAVNCKALSDSVLESELFGHEKGAFTGADHRRAGVFERASGGTVFLDEIGEIGPSFQTKLLRVLQEREVQPVGATQPVAVNTRVVAATNRELDREVAEGRFREDLYFRLMVIPIALAPLSARPEDILPLARFFLRRFTREMDKRLDGMSPELEQHLLGHPWPGNVRELSNLIERGVVLAEGPRLELPDVVDDPADAPSEATLSLAAAQDAATAAHVRRVLEQVDGKRAQAAQLLGIDRTTLYRLMKKHGLA